MLEVVQGLVPLRQLDRPGPYLSYTSPVTGERLGELA